MVNKQYDEYLKQHIESVGTGISWLAMNLPEVVQSFDSETLGTIASQHDNSKYTEEEYDAYADYFYGEKTEAVEAAFDAAWLHHQHNNPHHWQHWLLREDDGGTKCIEMPERYVIEMIADWWAFSWKANNLYEIFDWYKKNKSKIVLHENTQKLVEDILDKLKAKLDEVHSNVNKE